MCKRVVALMTVTAFLLAMVSCATSPDRIQATYVSPARYASWSCEQVWDELKRVESQLGQTEAAQKKKATGDAIGMGIGMVLFWPALFLLAAGEDQKQELARLKGEHDALTEVYQKKCGGIQVKDKEL